jgi:hypothetical protein
MGGRGSGPKRDQVKRDRALKMRRRGLTVIKIARKLGVTLQAVDHLLADLEPVRCRASDAEVCRPRKGLWLGKKPLCLACLAKRPDAPFPERLRAYRLARG